MQFRRFKLQRRRGARERKSAREKRLPNGTYYERAYPSHREAILRYRQVRLFIHSGGAYVSISKAHKLRASRDIRRLL